MMWLWITCSISLQHTDVYDTGRLFEGLLLSPFLNIGATFADFQSSGMWPWSRVAWNMVVRAGVMGTVISFRNLVESSSGSVALWRLRPRSKFRTPFCSTFMSGAVGTSLLPRSGMYDILCGEDRRKLLILEFCLDLGVAMEITVLLQWWYSRTVTLLVLHKGVKPLVTRVLRDHITDVVVVGLLAFSLVGLLKKLITGPVCVSSGSFAFRKSPAFSSR